MDVVNGSNVEDMLKNNDIGKVKVEIKIKLNRDVGNVLKNLANEGNIRLQRRPV